MDHDNYSIAFHGWTDHEIQNAIKISQIRHNQLQDNTSPKHGYIDKDAKKVRQII